MTFARTKIQAPQPRATFIARGALQQRLAQALQTHRAVLVCAPAGFGKTSLLAHEAGRLPTGQALAWVSADPGDDLHRLLECMFTALEPYDPPWRTAPEALVARATEATADARRSIAAEIINTLDACEVPHGLIVFDDVHRITDAAFFEFLDLLIERLSARWTIALTAREDPPLALARLRATGELAEFRQLHFDRDEARALAAGAGLNGAVADQLFDRTQGWPAGLRLAISAASAARGNGIDAARRSRSADIDRPLFEYLVAEVLDRLRPELRDFLARVSVLPELEPLRCARVSENPRAARLLDEIERLGLFVDVLDVQDAQGPAARSLRMHDLLRDALQRRLQLEQPELLVQLQQRAAASEPDPVRRIGLLLAAGQPAEAARLLGTHGPVMLATGSASSVIHLLRSFEPAFALQSAELQFVRGLLGWYQWDFVDMMTAMKRAEAAYAERGEYDPALFARAYKAAAYVSLGRLLEGGPVLREMRKMDLPPHTRVIVLTGLMWLALETGELRSIAPMVEESVRLLEICGRIDLWYQNTPSARLPGLPGMTRPLQRHAQALLRVGGDEPTPLRALAYCMQARRYLWEANFERATHFIELARADAQWAVGSAPVRSHTLAQLSLWHAMRGEREQALAMNRQRLNENQSGYGLSGEYHVLQFAARIAAICDDLETLRETAERLRQTRSTLQGQTPLPPDLQRSELHRPLAGNIAWLEGRRDDAIAAWSEALTREESIDLLGQAADVRVRLAHALLDAGDLAQAATVLHPVFTRARDEGAPGGALLAADALRDLAAFDWGETLEVEQQQMLRGWWALLSAARGVASASAPPAADEVDDEAPDDAESVDVAAPGGLTRRELEVLQRIAAGDSNKLIARGLDLSPHTVKRHVAHILDKLQLESRGQAAAWYRDHVG